MSDEHFVVKHSKTLAIVGIVTSIPMAIVLVGVTLSQQISGMGLALVFYGTFGLLIVVGLFLILKSLKCKMVVDSKEIIVFSIFNRPYKFLVGEIVSVVREEKHIHYGKRERILIEYREGRKLIVESSQISYEKLINVIESNVCGERLVGFENRSEDPSLINSHIIESIKLLASAPGLQLSFCQGKVDEIASELDSWLLIYENDTAYRYMGFSKNEIQLISDLNMMLTDFNDEQWTESAIRTSPKWEDVRIQAREVLNALGIEYSEPKVVS